MLDKYLKNTLFAGRHTLAGVACLAAAIGAMQGPAVAVPLAKDGVSRCVLLAPQTPDENEKRAVADLKTYLERMSGAAPETREVAVGGQEEERKKVLAEGKTPVLLGRLALPAVAGNLGARQDVRGSFAFKSGKDGVYLAGPGEGTYYAALELLEQQGVRWFMPGDLGEVVPELKTIEVKDQLTVQSPSFPTRWFQMPDRDWQMRVRCGGETFLGGHGIKAPPYALNKTTKQFEPVENAEYYALYKGQRVPRQHCLSNPKLIEYVVKYIKERRKAGANPVFPLGPNDGAGFCECERCKALDAGDYDAFSGEPSVTDRYIWFFNRVLEQVKPEYPDTKVAFYIYHTYMRPPLREKPDVAIQGALAPIALDRVHGFSNPVSPEKGYAKWLLQEWGKLLPDIYDRSYWSNLSDPGFPFIIIDRLKDEIPESHRLGLKGFRVETFANYAPQFPTMYIAGRLMWDHTANVDELLKDCYSKFFGPAAGPMGQYITLMDAALRDGDFSTGSAWNMPDFYPPAVREKARAFLAAGAQQAGEGNIYARRVQVITQSFEMLEAFCAMMDLRAQHKYVEAQAQLTRLDAVAGELKAIKPVPMLWAGRFSTYDNYMKRFFRGATEQGNARVTNGNQFVAGLPDEWEFLQDPLQVGEAIGWYKAEFHGGNWQRLKTSSASWSDQGLRYYKGLAWYRAKVDIPANQVGKRIFLWCGGVDETAKVWVNGKPIGISPGAAFYPFEMDATDAVKAGTNVVTICVANLVVNEIGTGGIVAPVMFYAPAKGKDAVLENVRDLKPTFP